MGLSPHESSDERLIKAIVAGDDEAFTQLINKYKHKVFSLAARFALNNGELEDICQDVFIKTYEKLATFRHDAPFEHWLARITTRTCYDVLRRRKRHTHFWRLDSTKYDVRDQSMEDRQAAEQAGEFIEWGLSKLRPRERLIISLLELEEKSVSEIAGLTGWSEINVRVSAYRARQKLKKILEESHE